MKILILSNQDPTNVGGVEKYNKKLIEIINENGHKYNLINFSSLMPKNYYFKFKTKNAILAPFYLWKYILNARKEMKKIPINNYDLIIDSTYIYFKKIMKQKNYLWVQHNCPNFYKGLANKNIFLNLLNWLFFKFCLIGDFFKSSNIVFFDKYNSDNIKKRQYQKFYYCMLSAFNKQDILRKQNNFNGKKHVAFLGRIDNKQKNIKILNKSKTEILVYGKGIDIKKISNNKNIIYKKPYKEDELVNIFKDIKYTLLPSKFEGFPFVAVESLSFGIPILIMDSFPSAKSLVVNENFLAKNNKDFLKKLIN